MLFYLKALVPAILLSAAALGCPVEAPGHFEINAQPKGIDVSEKQPSIIWQNVVKSGVSFAYIKATEGTSYMSPYFNLQYTGAFDAHIIRGGYHIALPDRSSGIVQANWFVSHGGGWSSDGWTLPGAVYLGNNPYGPTCYGLSPPAMVKWIQDFTNTYLRTVARRPVIYTTTNWWRMCTGNTPVFGAESPLWIVQYAGSVGPLPNGWKSYTFWQYSDHGPVPGDQDYYNGDPIKLKLFAGGVSPPGQML